MRPVPPRLRIRLASLCLALLLATVAGYAFAGTATAGTITGTVYEDLDQNGVRDPGEPGLPGIPVTLSSGLDATAPAFDPAVATVTGPDGRYALTTAEPGLLVLRTGWFRSVCPGLSCDAAPPGNGFRVVNEILSSPGRVSSGVFDAGLIPDAGQHLDGTPLYAGYPPPLAAAHGQDLAVRSSAIVSPGCVQELYPTCPLGGTVRQAAIVLNSGLTAVGGIEAVVQIPYGMVYDGLRLLPALSSPGVTGITIESVTPATRAPTELPLTAADFTTVRVRIEGGVPAGGVAWIVADETWAWAWPGGDPGVYVGVTGEDGAAADRDSSFCASPAVPGACSTAVNTTHSILDAASDDADSSHMTPGAAAPASASVVDLAEWATALGPAAGAASGSPGLVVAAAAPVPTSVLVRNAGREALVELVVASTRLRRLTCDFSPFGGPASGTGWAGPLLPGQTIVCAGSLPGPAPAGSSADAATVTAVGASSRAGAAATSGLLTSAAPVALGVVLTPPRARIPVGRRASWRIRVRSPLAGTIRASLCLRLDGGQVYLGASRDGRRVGRRRCWTLPIHGARGVTLTVTTRVPRGTRPHRVGMTLRVSGAGIRGVTRTAAVPVARR